VKRLMLLTISPALILGTWTLAGEAPAKPGKKPKPETKTDELDPKLKAKIAELIKLLGHTEYDKREEAEKGLLEIGRPALKQVEAATKDKDAERATRAKELVAKLKLLADPSKVDRNCTNGWMAVYGEQKQVQTFKAPADLEIDTIRFRAARGHGLPGVITVEVRKLKEEKDEKALASGTVKPEWTTEAGNVTGVSRFMTWFDVTVKFKLQKGETYRLVFSSSTSDTAAPWLVNCLYRDVFKSGSHLRLLDGKSKKLGAYDLVFQLCANGKARIDALSSSKIELPKREHFGLGHDGADMRNVRRGLDQFGQGLL